MSKRKISVILPVFNEEENIPTIVETLSTLFDEQLTNFNFEIIFVDDGSKDKSWSLIEDLTGRLINIKGIMFSRNFGQQAAFTAGMLYADGDVIITMDCDFQDPPELIPEMVKLWEEGYLVVYARRISRSDPFLKRATAYLFYRILSHTTQFTIPRNVGDFRLIDKVVLTNLKRLGEQARYLRGMVPWLGFKYTFVDYARPTRKHGSPQYSLRKMVSLAMDGILNFTFLPLLVGLWIGAISIVLSGGFLFYMTLDTLFNHQTYPLYKWLFVVLFGFIGAQFAFLWIIGEYIGRVFNDVRGRPLYIMADVRNLGPNKTFSES